MMSLPTSNEMRLGVAEARLLPHPSQRTAATTDWREALPVLYGSTVTLRELELSDAPALHALLTAKEVARFITPPPTTVAGFEKFILWAQAQRRAGRYACFAVVPHGMTTAVGLFQVRQLESTFATAEWGFALGSTHWGTGIFSEAAPLVVDFALDTIGVRRLEARAVVQNGRGNGALRKIGAVCEAILRESFMNGSEPLDQALWTILKSEWRDAKAVWGVREPIH